MSPDLSIKNVALSLKDRLKRLAGMDIDGSPEEAIDLIAPLLNRLTRGARQADMFARFQQHELHVLPVHFYEPIPDTRTLDKKLWEVPSQMVGIDLQTSRQLELVEQLAQYSPELADLPMEVPAKPDGFYLMNGAFGGTDALHAYALVRHFRPRRVIEVGSGYSSRIIGQAGIRNGDGMRLTCIEPFPSEALSRGFDGVHELITKKVQDVPFDVFEQLEENDILFIDSSHVSKCGSDVNYEILELIPRLRPGVIVHVHDIFLPREFPENWVKENLLFWNEQYLLQAFLSFNSSFEVLLANAYLGQKFTPQLRAAFPRSNWWGGSSFWFRRVTDVPLDVRNPRRPSSSDSVP